jgi:UDP-3-O-[3-hydroxymyristoyl] glucosamine N-acyltransferase
MSDPQFFPREAALTLPDIAALTGGEVARAAAVADLAGVAALDRAGPSDVAFCEGAAYLADLAQTRAGACLIQARFLARVPVATAAIVVREPARAFATVARAFFPRAARPQSVFGQSGLSSAAHIHPTAKVEEGVTLDPGVVIGPHAEIGAGTIIAAQSVVGPHVRIGREAAIGPGVSISHAFLGDRVIVHAGARIGQDGFGYLMGRRHEKIVQVGRVIIQDDVEIGANTTIDRGANRDTMIGEGTKIDNLVQIAHNVVIGRHCVIVAQTGIAGSSTLEDYVVLGARVAVNGHVRVGEGAQIAATSGILSDVPSGVRWGGSPAKPMREWFREIAALKRLAQRTAPGSDDTGSHGEGT